MTGTPRALSLPAFLRPAFAASILFLTAPVASAQGWEPFGRQGDSGRIERGEGVTREELAPSAAYEEQTRGIVREELDPVMAADGSGLPYEIWSGLSAEQFAQAIAALELPPRSPTLHALWRRLIASDATPADGVGNARFTALRVEALDQSGLVDEAAAVLAKDPAADSDPLLRALTARSEIGLGNMERGCEIGKGLVATRSELPKPIEADIILINGICAASQGNRAAAGIQAGLMRELDLGGAGADLLDAVAGGLNPEFPADTKLTLLDYRIAALANDVDWKKMIAAASPALLAGLAHDPRVSPDVRLLAGEKAAALNSIPIQDLAALYRTDGAGSDAGTIEREGLFKSAEMERTPLRKARLIRAFLDEARRADLYWQALLLMAEQTRALEPTPEIGWFAETAIEINLASGNYDGARAWTRIGDAFEPSPSGGNRLAHWVALADIADPGAGAAGSASSIAHMSLDARFDPALLHRLATVLDALGMGVPTALWDLASRSPQPAGGHLPDTGVLSELSNASQKKQFGRTVLLVLRTIGPQGSEAAHMIALGDALRALKRAGLSAEARQLALEALLGAWPRSVSQ
jgi:hypothetical protein